MPALATQPYRPIAPADALAALSDVTRRRLLDALRTGGPASLEALAAEFALTRLRLGQHLRLLREVGLVRIRKTGGRTVARYSPVGWARLKRRWERGMTRPVRAPRR